jgi:hypothetical protein
MTTPIYTCSATGLPAIDAGGCKRLLAKLPPDTAWPAWMPRFSDAFPKVPRSQWNPINRRSIFSWVLDQGEHGSCTDHGGCYAQRKTRVLQGMSDVELSATFAYAQVNGGRDRGARDSDILTIMQSKGRCLMSEFPETKIYERQIPPSAFQTAERFKVTDAWKLADFDEIVSAIQYGFIPVFDLQVGDNFNDFDADGAVGFSRGPGNHCVHGDGCSVTNAGRWLIDMQNSWGPTWGNQGRGGVAEEHVNSVDQDAYAIRVALDDPQDSNQSPSIAN